MRYKKQFQNKKERNDAQVKLFELLINLCGSNKDKMMTVITDTLAALIIRGSEELVKNKFQKSIKDTALEVIFQIQNGLKKDIMNKLDNPQKNRNKINTIVKNKNDY